MNKEQIIRELTEQLLNLIQMPEEYVPEYFDSVMDELEISIEDGLDAETIAPELLSNFADVIENDAEYSDLIQEFIDLIERAQLQYHGELQECDEECKKEEEKLEEETRHDYNVKYGGANGPFDEIYKFANGPATQSAEKKPAIKGTPHFKYDESDYGPIPRSGVGRRDYNVKYSKTGSILEEKLYEKIWNEGRKKPGVISPALKEAVYSYETRKKLIENKIIDKNDLDLLEEDSKKVHQL
jgi:hypothetical protein